MTDVLDRIRRLRPAAEADPEILERTRRSLMNAIHASDPAREAPPVTQAMVPQLAYGDLAAALDWLTRAFGFREDRDARFVDHGKVGHAEMDLGNGTRFMLGTSGGHGLASPRSTGGTGQMLCVYVDDVEAHYERARAAGARIRAELEDKFWGDRTYEVEDCEGHIWAFHQRLREVAREDWPDRQG